MTRDIGTVFRDLHRPGDPFILANAWDRGSALMLQGLGAKAIGTTSSGHAFTLGRPDGAVTRDEALAHAQELISVLEVPVSGDFEDGFAESPDAVAETVRLSGEIGLAGISIEDIVQDSGAAYDRELAVERIRAASAAARALPGDFVLIARADGVLKGRYDMAEAMTRIRAFDAAGADGLYVPIPPGMDEIRAICAVTSKPVNALAAGPFTAVSRAEFASAGVARISLGSAIARATHRVIHDAGRAMFDDGDFTPLATSIATPVVDGLLGRKA